MLKENKKERNKGIAEERAESKSWKLGGTVLTEKELLGYDNTTESSDQSKSHFHFFSFFYLTMDL